MNRIHADNTTGRMRLAIIVGIAVMLVSGAGYRTLARRLNYAPEHLKLAPGTLARLPMQIQKWAGRDDPLSESVIRATETDDHVNRTYTRANGWEGVGLFIAYGALARDLAPHRPEVCYPGGGWVLKAVESAELPVDDEWRLPCRIFKFSRGGFDARAVTVLNYYLVDGEYCEDVSLLRSRFWRGQASIGYMAQVQITCSGGTPGELDAARRAVEAFAAESARAIQNVLPAPGASRSQGPGG